MENEFGSHNKTWRYIDHFSKAINSIDTRVIFFLLLVINYTSFVITGNEEQYLSISKQFLDPNWIPGSFHLTEWPGARIINQSIAAVLLKFFSIPTVAFFAKWANFILLSIPAARIFKSLKISNIEILFLFQLFYINQTHGDQSFFSDEWIFGEFQGKTMSYIFVLYALSDLLEKRFLRSTIFSIIATYFHVLVGGWFFAISTLFYLFGRFTIKESAKYVGLYIVSLLPLIIFLVNTILVKSDKVIDGTNMNWVYVYFRHAHHLNPFDDLTFFRATAFSGVRTIVIASVILFLYRKLLADQKLKYLNNLVLCSFLIIYFFLGVAFIDRFVLDRSGIFLLQLYPFRVTAISKFMFLLLIAGILKEYFMSRFSKEQINNILLIIVIPFLLSRTARTAGGIYKSPGLGTFDQPIIELSNYVKQNTEKKDIFYLSLKNDDTIDPSFYRALERSRYANYKFVPAGTNQLYHWYQRVLNSRKIDQNIEELFPISKEAQIKYLLTDYKIEHQKLNLIYSNNRYQLYRINIQEF